MEQTLAAKKLGLNNLLLPTRAIAVAVKKFAYVQGIGISYKNIGEPAVIGESSKRSIDDGASKILTPQLMYASGNKKKIFVDSLLPSLKFLFDIAQIMFERDEFKNPYVVQSVHMWHTISLLLLYNLFQMVMDFVSITEVVQINKLMWFQISVR